MYVREDNDSNVKTHSLHSTPLTLCHTVTADELVTKGAMASVTMVWTKFSQNGLYFSLLPLIWSHPAAVWFHIDGLVQERRNFSALAIELRLSCTKPSIYASGIIDT